MVEEGAPLRFAAVVEIKPAISLGTYTGIAVRHAPTAVSDEDVDKALQDLQVPKVLRGLQESRRCAVLML